MERQNAEDRANRNLVEVNLVPRCSLNLAQLLCQADNAQLGVAGNFTIANIRALVGDGREPRINDQVAALRVVTDNTCLDIHCYFAAVARADDSLLNICPNVN